MKLVPSARTLFFTTTIGSIVTVCGIAAWSLWPLVQVEICIRDLLSGDLGSRRDAAWLLEEMGPEASAAIPALRDALKDDDAELRVRAARALCKISAREDSAFQVLLSAVELPPLHSYATCGRGGYDAQDMATGHLSRASPLDIDRLIGALKHERMAVRAWAAVALSNIGPPAQRARPALIDATQDDEALVRVEAALALWQIERHANITYPILIDALKEPDETVSRARWDLIRELGPEAAPALVEALSNPDFRIRAEAAKLLGRCGWPETGPALVVALQDESGYVAFRAAVALSELRVSGARAVPVLVEATRHTDSGIRLAALRAVQFSPPMWFSPPTPEVVQALLDATRDRESSVREQAISTLETVAPADEAVCDALLAALGDSTADVRSSAAHALGKLAAPSSAAIPVLRALMERDEDEGVRRAAFYALNKMARGEQQVTQTETHKF